MTLGELLDKLHVQGVRVSSPQIHRAIASRFISRPERDGSGRYVYAASNLEELLSRYAPKPVEATDEL